MKLKDRIELLSVLGKKLSKSDEQLDTVVRKAYHHNRWFVEDNVRASIRAICQEFLDKDKLTAWTSQYDFDSERNAKTVGLVMAGNIPLVGFHDWLCTFIAGHKSMIKLSEKDKILLPYILDFLADIAPETKEQNIVVDFLKDFDAVIATGSNNSSRYFETYFGKYPNIIRKNRTSVAVLNGKESEEELMNLGQDIFKYFGLGCRNVSKIYVPKGFDFERLLEVLHEYREIVLHHKYKNNFDYNFSMLILNKIKHFSNGCLLIHENESFHSRIADLHYSVYKDITNLAAHLNENAEQLQCVVTGMELPLLETVKFGETQTPTLSDYADGVNTLQFMELLRQN